MRKDEEGHDMAKTKKRLDYSQVAKNILANVGGKAEKAKYFTFFTLFHADGIIAGESKAVAGIFILLTGAAVFYASGLLIFDRKDLHI